MKIKFSYYIKNGQDGSASVHFFDSEEAAEKYAEGDDERYCDGDIFTKELEFDDSGKMLTPNPKSWKQEEEGEE